MLAVREPGPTMKQAPRWHIDADALAVLEAVFKLDQFPNNTQLETRKQLGIDLTQRLSEANFRFGSRIAGSASGRTGRRIRCSPRRAAPSSASLSSGDTGTAQTDGAADAVRIGLPLAALPAGGAGGERGNWDGERTRRKVKLKRNPWL